MAFELERKFHLTELPAHAQNLYSTGDFSLLCQGYLHEGKPTTRVRIDKTLKQAWLTIKGKRTDKGKPEYEYTIPYAEGVELLALCGSRLVEKARITENIQVAGRNVALLTFDVFRLTTDPATGKPLLLAELEKLPFASDEDFNSIKLPWMTNAVEVTAKKGWSNRSIAKNKTVPLLPLKER